MPGQGRGEGEGERGRERGRRIERISEGVCFVVADFSLSISSFLSLPSPHPPPLLPLPPSSLVGRAGNLHLAHLDLHGPDSPSCHELADIYEVALDAAKTGMKVGGGAREGGREGGIELGSE